MFLEVPTAWLLNFVLLLARTSGLFVFVPIPGARGFPVAPKIVLSATLAFLLLPAALSMQDASVLESPAAIWNLAGMLLGEAVFGLAIGASTSLLLEAFGLAAQILGFQAGYSYINMVDPTTQVDASILNVLFTLLSGLLFFAFDLHLHLVRALATSLEQWPLGGFVTRPADAQMVTRLGGAVFETGVRLAFPVIATLLLIDLTLGLLNQVNSRLQLLTLAFPIKILAAIALIHPLLRLSARLFYDLAEKTQFVIESLVNR